jgi:hypothetical protein
MKKHKHLAEGEVTGHHHTVLADDAFVVGTDIERQLYAPTGTPVIHEEHGERFIPPGDYIIDRQREIDPDTEEARRVAD